MTTTAPERAADGGDATDGGAPDGGGRSGGRVPAAAASRRGGFVALVAAGAGFAATVATAFDALPFGNVGFLGGVALIALVCAVGTGAVVAAAAVVGSHPGWTPFSARLRGWFLVVAAGLVLFTGWAWVWVLAQSAIPVTGRLVVAAGGIALAAGAGWVAWRAANPARASQGWTTVATWTLQVVVGLAVGAFAALAPVIAVSVARWTQSDDAITEPPRGVADVDGYVALGDSYSAGEGLEPYEPGTQGVADGGDRCHRSDDAYSQQLGIFDPDDPDDAFRACSGAITVDLYTAHTEPREPEPGEPTADVPAQVSPDDSAELVTLTMGGNDLAFSEVVKFCLEVDDCTNQPFDPFHEDTPDRPLDEWALAKAESVTDRLAEDYERLRGDYPRPARIVVLGYPYLFPPGEPGVSFSDCDTILRKVSTKERTRLRELQDVLTRSLYETATAAGIEFVSPQAVWDGHEPCGDRGQYTNALNPVVFDGSFHPNRSGQLAYATLLACYLRSTEAPDGPGDRVLLPWETGVTGAAPAPGTLARPVPCPAAEPGP